MSTTTIIPRSRLDGQQCQLYLDVRPDGFTLVADVTYPSSETNDWADQLDPASRELLDRMLGRVDRFIEQISEQLDAPLLLEGAVISERREMLLLDNRQLACENRQLREALEECVLACEGVLEKEDESQSEGREADHARAWVALDAARQALGE